MKKKLSYWQKRYLKTKQLQLSKAEAYEKEYAKRLKETQKLIEQEIDSWCKKYAKKDGTIDPIDAKKLLKGSELKDFKYSLAEWERTAKQGGFNHEMDLEYYRSRVSRLQALQLQVTGLMGKQTSGDVKSLEGLLKGSYNDTYYRNIYNSQAVKGKFSSNFAHVDDKKLNAVIHSGWKGSNFSTRLWVNAAHTLPKTLSETLFRGIALGYGPDRLTQMARVKLKDFSENQIHRLVTTEAAHIVEQATLDSYKEIGLEKYEYLATLESHTCEVCGKLDGQVMEVSKQETGTNYPPIHPYCRCTTVPWDKWFEENDIKRWSRNEETGKGESIEDMSYSKWKEDVFDKPKQTEDGIMKVKRTPVDEIKIFMSGIDMKKASHEDLTMLGSLVNNHFDVSGNIGNKDKLKEIFSNFREIGGEVPKDGWAKGSGKEAKRRISEAFSYYPKEWAEYAYINGKGIYTKDTKRGFFSEHGIKGRTWRSGIADNAVSIMLSKGSRTVNYHEIGHYVEYFNPEALRMSKLFLEYRTKDEKEISMSDILYWYGQNERTKKDNFISPYIGRTYKNATEILSMGLESLFEPQDGHVFSQSSREATKVRRKITDDVEYLNFIIGMYLKG
ncbi:minor capsid protein [Lactococcus petauri]